MGREIALEVKAASFDNRPAILVLGSPNVGKRTLLSRMLDVNFEDVPDLSSEVQNYGWTIDTKYYTADVSVWVAHLDDGFSFGKLPIANKLSALVMVFDMNDMESFVAIQKWVSRNDIKKIDILLCIGNKADLLPGHFAHTEYRRLLQKGWVSFSDPDPEFLDYGNLESEGSSLLGDEEPSWELRRSCLEWCIEQNIEYVEACASNTEFDKCLSVGGDSQGVERLYGALSAHMWPGMVLKSANNTIAEPYQPEKEASESSEEDSDYEVEYEVLSAGSAEPWDDTEPWVSANGAAASSDNTMNAMMSDDKQENKLDSNAGPSTSGAPILEHKTNGNAQEPQPCTSEIPASEKFDVQVVTKEKDEPTVVSGDACLGFEDLEQLMNEIGNVRDNLRLMPDFQRREMAAKLAMKMATMFGDSAVDEEEFN